MLGGRLLAKPDAWWPDRALVVEIDSREWHLSPDDWEATMARDGRLRAVGIRVIHVTPRQVRTEPNSVQATIADALRIGEPVPRLITLPAAA
jgi:very-short-patch-repair endonuclease